MNEEKAEQIRAILESRVLEFACQKLGVTHMARREYSEVFDVTKKEIKEYFEQSELPRRVYTSHNGHEGIHFVEEENQWNIYWLERGQRFDEQTFQSEKKAKETLLDWLLRTSGAGLTFEADPVDGGQ